MTTTLFSLIDDCLPLDVYSKGYRGQLRRAVKLWRQMLDRDPTIADLTLEAFKHYRQRVLDTGLSPVTVRNYELCLRRLAHWCAENGLCEPLVKRPEAGLTVSPADDITNTTRAPQCDPQMPLDEFVDQHYIPASGARTGKPQATLSKTRIIQLGRFCHLVALWLQRRPVVADLVPANIQPFYAWLSLAEKPTAVTGDKPRTGFSAVFNVSTFQSLCRVAGTIDYRGSRGKVLRVLSESGDTLWGICVTRYFKVRTSIRRPDTRRQYQLALADFRDCLGHEPKVTDLTQDNLSMMMKMLEERGLSAHTVNERRGRIVALWNWLAKRRETPDFPDIEKLPEPRRVPRAWNEDELQRLFHACGEQTGQIVQGIAAADFWLALHHILWDTGERIGAIMSATWSMLDVPTGKLEVPAEVRKGRVQDMLYQLHTTTVVLLLRMKPAGHERIFPWPYCEGTFYGHYRRILLAAGLPDERKTKFHRMRRSVASFLQAAGHDACTALGHSTPAVTAKSYLDPRIVMGGKAPCDVLPQPSSAPLRLEYTERAEPPVEVSPESVWL
jgi:integrase